MKRIKISPVDAVFANSSYPIEFLIYYKEKIQWGKIPDALEKLSELFWPVFGEFKNGYISFESYDEPDFFGVEKIDHDFAPAVEDDRFLKQHHSYIPINSPKLFYLKMLEYNNGTVLVVKLNHLAGDGYSYFYFLSALAMISKKPGLYGTDLFVRMFNPLHDRSIIKNFHLSETIPSHQTDEDELTLQFEKVAKADVKNLIKEISEKHGKVVSTNDILSAMVIKKLTSISSTKLGKTFHLTIPVDVRRKVTEYGQHYFGNGLLFNKIEFNVEHLANSDIDTIALQIRNGMPGITNESYIAYLKGLADIVKEKRFAELRPYDDESNCLITNLSAMPSNKLDFGTGNPDLIIPLTIGRNSTAIMADDVNYILRIAY